MGARGARPAPALPSVIGHRGAAASAPENTLAGLRRAAALGCRWVEFDVRLSADGVLVLCHDSRLDRTTDGRGRVASQTAEQIRRYDAGGWFAARFAGEPIPTLDDALDLAIALGLGTNIEIKADRGRVVATGTALAATLHCRRGRLPPLLVTSFLPGALAAMRENAPEFPRGLLRHVVPPNWPNLADRLGCVSIHVNHRWLDPNLAEAIRRAGYRLLAFTINDPVRARQLFSWGVTSVFSAAPELIVASCLDAT